MEHSIADGMPRANAQEARAQDCGACGCGSIDLWSNEATKRTMKNVHWQECALAHGGRIAIAAYLTSL
jgi:hypothetical protein